MTLFERIAARELPSEIVYEDDEIFAFRDINPQAPVHVLIVPKRVIPRIGDAAAEDAPLLGRLLLTGQWEHQVRLWQAGTDRPALQPLWQSGDIKDVILSRDGGAGSRASQDAVP